MSDPVLTSYGVHIIKFHDRRNVKGTPQDAIQSRLIKVIRRDREKSPRQYCSHSERSLSEVENLDEQALAERLLERLKALE